MNAGRALNTRALDAMHFRMIFLGPDGSDEPSQRPNASSGNRNPCLPRIQYEQQGAGLVRREYRF